jgi:hypothetical protein
VSAADAARLRADQAAQELRRDAVSIKLDLERVIRSLAEDGTCSGTSAIVLAIGDLDRKVAYLRGLREGLEYAS